VRSAGALVWRFADPGRVDVVGEAAEQGEVDAIDVAADGGKDGETK